MWAAPGRQRQAHSVRTVQYARRTSRKKAAPQPQGEAGCGACRLGGDLGEPQGGNADAAAECVTAALHAEDLRACATRGEMRGREMADHLAAIAKQPAMTPQAGR